MICNPPIWFSAGQKELVSVTEMFLPSTLTPLTSDDVSGVKVDGKNISVTLTSSFCPALNQIGGLQIIPKSVYGKYFDPKDASKNLDDAPENSAPPVAS